MGHCTILQDQTFTLEVMFQFSKLMKTIDRRFHIYIGSKRLHLSYLENQITYSTRVIIPLSVLENTAANGVTPSLSATSRDDGECSERNKPVKTM